MIKIYAKHVVFKELAKSICKCLISLKYHTIFVNKINENDNELYIIYGGHELTCYPPKNYIVYNLEQTNVNNKIFEGEYKLILQNAQEIWDYSIDNLCFLRNLLNRSIMYVPPRYSPVLEIHGKKIYAKEAYQNPDKYFTPEVLQALDEIAQREFSYGS